jgi:predicted ribosomally synthesized peptide with SipW-like signal peptide
MSIVLSLGVIGSNFAFFTDVETSTDNIIAAGTWHLQPSDVNEWFDVGVNQVSTSWTMSNMMPGVTTVGPFSVTLHDSALVTTEHIEISFNHASSGDVARWTEITVLTYDGTNFVANHVDANGNGFFDLEDVTLPPYANDDGLFDNLPAPIGDRTCVLTLALKTSSQAPEGIQGETLISTVNFTLSNEPMP